MKVLKFGAVWCKECLVMRPIWKEIEAELPDLATEYFDLDDQADKAKEYRVEKAPTFVFLDREGVEFLRIVGPRTKEELIAVIKENSQK